MDLLTNLLAFALLRAISHYSDDTGSCLEQISGVLLQEQPNRPNIPFGLRSITMNQKEKDLATTLRKCLAVIWTVPLLHRYLDGNRLIIPIDYGGL